jgi:hypothetical protein
MTVVILESQADVDLVAGEWLEVALSNGLIVFDSEFDRDGLVAVAQLMLDRDTIYVIRISGFPRLPEVVRTILTDPRIVKIGHSLESDERAFTRTYGFGIRSKLDVRRVLMTLGTRVPSMGRKSNLKGLMTVLVPDLPAINLPWYKKVDWRRLDTGRIAYLESDVRGVYEICARSTNEENSLTWSTFRERVPGIEVFVDREVTQNAWLDFNK